MKTVDKAMTLLRQFSLDRLEIGLNDLSRMTGEDKAVTRRLLLSLAKHGFVEQDPDTRKYFLGPGFLALARLREATVPMVRAAQVVSEWLCHKTNETVHVGMPGRTGMLTVAYKLPARGNVINLRPAEGYPFHASASGLAFLSFCTESTRERLLDLKRERLTRYTILDRAQLLEFFSETRSRGYACTRNSVEIGVSSVAMTFFVDGDDPAGTVSIAVPDANLTKIREMELVSSIRFAVDKLELALTGRTKVAAP